MTMTVMTQALTYIIYAFRKWYQLMFAYFSFDGVRVGYIWLGSFIINLLIRNVMSIPLTRRPVESRAENVAQYRLRRGA